MSGPGTVTFSAPNQARTTASFSASGAYVLQLTASDTQYTAGSTVTITVLPPNTPPVVSAGPDQTITLPAAAVLNGTATDDGLPPGSALSISWSKLSGPGTATFANANQAATTATFSTAGVYVLRLTASDSRLAATSEATVTVNTASTPPVAGFTTPGIPRAVLSTLFGSSGASSPGNTAANLLDNDPASFWQTATGAQFAAIQFSSAESQLVDRVQLQAQSGLGTNNTLKDFDIQVSLTPNDADFVTVASGVLINNGLPQEFVFPGGPVRARYAKLIGRTNYGGASTTLGTFNVMAAGMLESAVSLPAQTSVAVMESPSLVRNGARVVRSSAAAGSNNSPKAMLTGTGSGWTTTGVDNQFAIVELAGAKLYTLDGVRIQANNGGVRDFEVWVSTASTDATAFTKVLSGATASSTAPQTFLFPGGSVQARWVKYVPVTGGGGSAGITTGFFDVIAEGAGRVVEFSSSNGIPDQAFDGDASTLWTSLSQATNQFLKVLLAGGQVHKLYGVRIGTTQDLFGGTTFARDFDIRVSTTTADESAFRTVLSGTAQNATALLEFPFSAPVEARYVEFLFKQGAVSGVNTLEALELPGQSNAGAAGGIGSVLRSFTSQLDDTKAAALALDIDSANGPWISANGQTSNQALVIMLPGANPVTIDQVVLQPGWITNFQPFITSIGAKNFDLLVSTTDTSEAAFSIVFSGVLQNTQVLQPFRFGPVQARFVKLLLKDNNGGANIALNSFYVISPEYGSTTARFLDRSTIASGRIVSYAWGFRHGGASADRDPVHVYATPGLYNVKLTVTNDAGQLNTTQTAYNAVAPFKADFIFWLPNAAEGTESVSFLDKSSPQLGLRSQRKWDTGSGGVMAGLAPPFLYPDSEIGRAHV